MYNDEYYDGGQDDEDYPAWTPPVPGPGTPNDAINLVPGQPIGATAPPPPAYVPPVPGPGTPNSAINLRPGQPITQTAPAPQAVAPPPAAQAGQWAPTNQGFLDWANKTYGQDPTRGNSFVNAQAAGGFQKMLEEYTRLSGNKATFLGGPSGDRVDFGQGVQDALTSDGMVWNADGGGRPNGGTISSGSSRGQYQTLMPMGDFGSMFGGNSASGSSTTQKGSDELFQMLMARARQSETVDPNDPTIRAQADNYNANLTRDGRRYLSELAERKGSGGNIGAEARMMAEKNAQASAGHEGALLQHEKDSRKAEIEHALSTGAQFMTQQQQMQLQEELAKIDNAMKLYQTNMQHDEFGRSLSQTNSQFERNLGQRAYEYDTDDDYRWNGPKS